MTRIRGWLVVAILGGAACTVQEHVVVLEPTDDDPTDDDPTDDAPEDTDDGPAEGDGSGNGETTNDPCSGDECGTTEDQGGGEDDSTSTGETTESDGEGSESTEDTT